MVICLGFHKAETKGSYRLHPQGRLYKGRITILLCQVVERIYFLEAIEFIAAYFLEARK